MTRGRWFPLAIAILSLVAVVAFSTACQGEIGPQGAQGAQGVQGPVGPTGPAPTNEALLALSHQVVTARKAELTGPQGVAGPQGPQGLQGLQGPTGSQGPAGKDGSPGVTLEGVNKAVDARFSTVDRALPLWAIQPGTAPRMIELTIYFNSMWFGAQAGNWDVARFEIYRSDETVKAIGVTRPARIPELGSWAEAHLVALTTAVEAKSLIDFEKAYDAAVAGCNACHKGSKGGPLSSMQGFKITRPTTPLFSNLDYRP